MFSFGTKDGFRLKCRMNDINRPLEDEKAVCAPTASHTVAFKNVVLIVAFTAFTLAFPFAMSILWFPETMLGVYVGATAVVSGVIVLIYIFIQSEKSRSKSLADTPKSR